MDTDRALEVVRGCLLSDASVFKQNEGGLARFSMDLSGGTHSDWLLIVKKALLSLGVLVSSIYPKVTGRVSRGKRYTECFLQSRMHPLLLRMHSDWYDGNTKRVPANLTLTPEAIAHWFMGDGSAYYHHGALEAKFATHSFPIEDVLRLANMLMPWGVVTRVNKHGPGSFYLVTSRKKSVGRLLGIVRPYVVPSYSYKIKEV